MTQTPPPGGAPRRALTAQLVISAGGWHPRFARVLLIEQDGGLGLALIDGNGDGAELELEYWQHDGAGRWHGGSSSGHGPLDGLRTAGWNAGPFVCAIGRAGPHEAVQVRYGGRAHRRVASELGVWGFIHAADSADPGELPAVGAPGIS
jgi:hypothetical protein